MYFLVWVKAWTLDSLSLLSPSCSAVFQFSQFLAALTKSLPLVRCYAASLLLSCCSERVSEVAHSHQHLSIRGPWALYTALFSAFASLCKSLGHSFLQNVIANALWLPSFWRSIWRMVCVLLWLPPDHAFGPYLHISSLHQAWRQSAQGISVFPGY